MTVEAIILIGVEKVWMIFPSLSQKLERFYKSVVEEALLGKDPDVAEDFTGGAVNMEKVVRQRQRDEKSCQRNFVTFLFGEGRIPPSV